MPSSMLLAVADAAPAAAPSGSPFILYLTAVVTVAALIYLTFAMIRPERF